MKIIARIHCDFKEKFGIPRQSGLVKGTRAAIVFEPEYRNPDALRADKQRHQQRVAQIGKIDEHGKAPLFASFG